MFKLRYLTVALVGLSLAAGISVASAAETGTKTMPCAPLSPSMHHRCYLPLEPTIEKTYRCDDQHSEQN